VVANNDIWLSDLHQSIIAVFVYQENMANVEQLSAAKIIILLLRDNFQKKIYNLDFIM
jgi:hypothetical protein